MRAALHGAARRSVLVETFEAGELISGLIAAKSTFDSAKHLANLTLKPSKRIIVPISHPVSSIDQDRIRSWMFLHLPEWRNFEIKDSAKYRGFYLGPAAAENQWKAPLSKWKKRGGDIAATGAAASIAAYLYNSRAVPCLSYKM